MKTETKKLFPLFRIVYQSSFYPNKNFNISKMNKPINKKKQSTSLILRELRRNHVEP